MKQLAKLSNLIMIFRWFGAKIQDSAHSEKTKGKCPVAKMLQIMKALESSMHCTELLDKRGPKEMAKTSIKHQCFIKKYQPIIHMKNSINTVNERINQASNRYDTNKKSMINEY